MADKVDFKKTLRSYKAKAGNFQIIDVAAMNYLMIDGHGDPNTSPQFAASLETLYPVAYKLKFASKNDLGRDYVVPPLEGLWWADDMDSFTEARDKSRWDWTMLLMTPDWIDKKLVDAAIETATIKSNPPRIEDLYWQNLSEGLCVQTLHIGPFDDEAEVLAELHDEFIPNQELKMTGKHHEIYLSDRRRTAPERLRTILRQPVASMRLPATEDPSG